MIALPVVNSRWLIIKPRVASTTILTTPDSPA